MTPRTVPIMRGDIGFRAAPIATMLVFTILLGGCGVNADRSTVGAIPDDYRTRHPIVLVESEHTMDIPVASGDRSLTSAMRDNIRGFAGGYLSKSSGSLQIIYPAGAYNSAAAKMLGRQLRTTLIESGVPKSRLIETSYQAGTNGDAAPIRLAFVATTAKTDTCGQWPEDLAENTFQNKNYHNFGCATQSNLAAQVANPMDLVAPRGMTPIDAERRQVVIDDYRSDGNFLD